jgi:putative hydrolase of the HAD superfamily
MLTLALDVDGVILDPDRDGLGHWTNALPERYGITRAQLREAFFMRTWDDVLDGRMMIEVALGEALQRIGADVGVDDVLDCWFEADFSVRPSAIELANQAASQSCRVVLATNQERRRATFLRERLGALFPIDDVVYSADIGHQKHKPEFFELATQRLGADPSDIVFVDDVAHNVDQASAAGWRAVHAAPDALWELDVAALLGLR